VSSASSSSQPPFERCSRTEPVFKYHPRPSKTDGHSHAKEEHVHKPEEFSQYKECNELKKKYNISPGKDWGDAAGNPTVQQQWKDKLCDEPFIEPTHHATEFTGRAGSHETLAVDINVHEMPSGSQWIGFLTPMTTSHTSRPVHTILDLPFWSVLFDTFLARTVSLRDDKDPFYFTFFIGYDDKDKILDNKENLIAIVKEMYRRLDAANICRHKVGVRFYTMSDTVHAPSWGVTHLAHSAYDLGVDWFYQINDDVEMKTDHWETKLTKALASTCNFGVTGPTDESNTGILTQSFTHRTHIEVFGYYFAMPFKLVE